MLENAITMYSTSKYVSEFFTSNFKCLEFENDGWIVFIQTSIISWYCYSPFYKFKNNRNLEEGVHNILCFSEYYCTLYTRYPKKFFRDLPRSSVLVCSDEIKFKTFFAFVVLDTIAWLNRLGSSKFHFIYLFFVHENPP